MEIRKISVILFMLGVVLFSCEDTREGDTLPPTVSVLSPHPDDVYAVGWQDGLDGRMWHYNEIDWAGLLVFNNSGKYL